MSNSFYSRSELDIIGFSNIGEDVLISRNTYIPNPERIRLGNNCRIDDFCVLLGNIMIGSHVHIAAWNYMNAGINKIFIGDFSTISGRGSIYAVSEGIESYLDSNCNSKENLDVIIENEVVFGMKSIILPGTIAKAGNSFGAMSVVAGIYEEWGINYNYKGSKFAYRVKDRKKELLVREKAFIDEYNKK